MGSPVQLTQSDIAALDALQAAGDVVGYYTYLENKGYDYARLARGVVRNDTFNGKIANTFLQNKADELGIAIDLSAINKRLMEEDFTARKLLVDNSSPLIELPVPTIRDYHTSVFAEFGLAPQAWTAYTPTVVARASDEEALWDELLAAGDKEVNV